MPASTAAPPMLAAGEGGALAFFLRPLVLHGMGAAAHLLLVLAVAGHLLSRRCVGLSTASRAKDGDDARSRGAFQCHGVAACAAWALAAAGVLSAAYACYQSPGGAGWSRDAVADLVDAATRAAAWLLIAAC
jgi:hypothetical protein